jgi:hypothetical protein
VHCSGSPAQRGDTAAIVCAWDIEKYRQHSYHWIVDENGKKTRCLPDNIKGAHVALKNTGNIGICYIGGVRKGGDPRNPKDCKDTRTPAQRKALQEIVAMYKKDHPTLIVRGHRDWPGVHKLCPCFDVASEL